MPPLCNHCGEPLNILETIANVERGPTLYPRVREDGQLVETLVRWLCRHCQRDATRLRGRTATSRRIPEAGKRRMRTDRRAGKLKRG